ncbi:MAG: hypothetical protein JNL10_18980 [Verrucomicrobiales bacterium]|nr:hypothetical protein [Verrucomicrobiales bacterium]
MTATGPMSGGPVIPTLARVVRGLLLLFWAVPGVLLSDIAVALDFTWRQFGFTPTAAAAAALVFGVRELHFFHPRERVWRQSLHRSLVLALIVLALAPIPVWWSRAPEERFFGDGMVMLVFAGLAFLVSLNDSLRRLSAMLPDETLRTETRFFTRLNIGILAALAVGVGLWLLLHGRAPNDPSLATLRSLLESSRPWLLILVLILPVALTMTLLWKIKGVILASVFRE